MIAWLEKSTDDLWFYIYLRYSSWKNSTEEVSNRPAMLQEKVQFCQVNNKFRIINFLSRGYRQWGLTVSLDKKVQKFSIRVTVKIWKLQPLAVKNINRKWT